MMKIVTMISAAAAIFCAQSASAATFGPVGSTHAFIGNVIVQKDTTSYTCTATVIITVNSATDVDVNVQGGALSGSFPCSLIAVTGTGDINWVGGDWGVTGLTIDPPLSSGICNGRIRFLWNGGTPRKIDLRWFLSDSTATTGNRCTMQGLLTPVGPSSLTLTP